MNIDQARDQIEGAVRAYLAKDERGMYLIPPQMQRPIILMGPPGLGKTAVVGQVAKRLNINYVSYSVTHHTRQSALGLPYIDDEEYDGKHYKVSRYTMSEIIASVYDAMRESGVHEGILFLDEINCVSETLAPAMLQFLQYKVFGTHKLPRGWVLVCAGNPPEYNRSARELDPAMLDRMKRIDVTPDLDSWLGFASSHGVHPAITTYLQNKPGNFYRVRATVDGTRIVTARVWEDLSRMLQAYEQVGIKADGSLVAQYLQDPEVAEDFTLYLELFSKYQNQYDIERVLDGNYGPQMVNRVKSAPFDERIAVVNLLDSALLARVHAVRISERAVHEVRDIFVAVADEPEAAGSVLADARIELERLVARDSASGMARAVCAEKVALLQKVCPRLAEGKPAAKETAKGIFNAEVRDLAARVRRVSFQLDAALDFCDAAFGQGEELLVLVTRLAVDPEFMSFVYGHSSEKFRNATQELMLQDRGLELLDRLNQLNGTVEEDPKEI